MKREIRVKIPAELSVESALFRCRGGGARLPSKKKKKKLKSNSEKVGKRFSLINQTNKLVEILDDREKVLINHEKILMNNITKSNESEMGAGNGTKQKFCKVESLILPGDD